IDCESSGRGFYFHLSEDEESILYGLTIRNGYVTDGGGAILCSHASPVIQNCRLENNTADSSSGGGMKCVDASPVIRDCTFLSNATLVFAMDSLGAGLYLSGSSAHIENCQFLNNDSSLEGGAVECIDSMPIIRGCLFQGNESEGHGGGLVFMESSITIIDCDFLSNHANHTIGGCIFYNNCTDVLIVNSYFYQSVCEFEGSAIYAASGHDPLRRPDAPRGQHIIANCLFFNNHAEYSNGTVYCDNVAPLFIHCTFTGNSVNGNGGAIATYDMSPVITNCILWGDTYGEISSSQGNPIVTYSDVELDSGVYEGEGNINMDPLFAIGIQGAFYLSQTAAGQFQNSPCLDAGNTAAIDSCIPVLDTEFCMDSFYTRTDHTTDTGVVDMGYHFRNACLHTGD
ncbi:MAG TPA: hypothetical protein PLV45_19190, partial [bacterium]|nr:hypothetical protein [bacterium]